MIYETPSDHPNFDPQVVTQIEALQSQFETGVEIATELLEEGVDIIPVALAFMHLGYRTGIYKRRDGRRALHVEPTPNELPPNIIGWSEFFLPKVIWGLFDAD